MPGCHALDGFPGCERDNPPTLLTRDHSVFDPGLWIATEVLHPAIALISLRPHLGILLAKNAYLDHDGTTLEAVTWIRIPRGWRLNLLRLTSLILPLRIPAEHRFNAVTLSLEYNGMFVARIPGHPQADGVLPHPSEAPYAVRMLTARAYRQLYRASGRDLHNRVCRLFADVPGVKRPPRPSGFAYAWTHRQPPWPIIAG